MASHNRSPRRLTHLHSTNAGGPRRPARGFKGWCSASVRLGQRQRRLLPAVVAAGAEDYYLREGEEPGRWLGAGIGRASTSRDGSAADDLRAVLDGRDPADAAPAGARARRCAGAHPRLRPHLLGAQVGLAARGARDPEACGPRCRRAPRRAVAAAIAYLEDHAAFLRRGANGASSSRPPAWWRRSSPTAPRAPATRPFTPTCWWPTWPRTTRAASGPSTAGPSTATPRPPATSTRPSCATS